MLSIGLSKSLQGKELVCCSTGRWALSVTQSHTMQQSTGLRGGRGLWEMRSKRAADMQDFASLSVRKKDSLVSLQHFAKRNGLLVQRVFLSSYFQSLDAQEWQEWAVGTGLGIHDYGKAIRSTAECFWNRNYSKSCMHMRLHVQLITQAHGLLCIGTDVMMWQQIGSIFSLFHLCSIDFPMPG